MRVLLLLDTLLAVPETLAAIHLKVPPKVASALAVVGGILIVLLLVGLFVAYRKKVGSGLWKAAPIILGAIGIWAAFALFYASRIHSRHQAIAERFAALQASASTAATALGDGASVTGSLSSSCEGKLPPGPPSFLAAYLGALPEGSVPPDVKMHGEFPRMLFPYEDSGLSIDSQPLSGRAPPSLVAVWFHLLRTLPFKWGYLAERPRNDLTEVKQLIMVKVRALKAPEASGSSVAVGRADLAVRVLPVDGGAPLCEGALALELPPRAASASSSLGAAFWLESGLESAPFFAVCKPFGDKLCEHVQRYTALSEEPASPAPEAKAPASALPAPAKAEATVAHEDGCSRDTIQRVTRMHAVQLRLCYEKGLRTKSDLNGRVVMGFTIDGKGRVSQAQVRSSTLQDPAVEQCLLARVRTWKFPAPSDGGECAIEYPFVFAPSH